jgi:hypothetical protein
LGDILSGEEETDQMGRNHSNPVSQCFSERATFSCFMRALKEEAAKRGETPPTNPHYVTISGQRSGKVTLWLDVDETPWLLVVSALRNSGQLTLIAQNRETLQRSRRDLPVRNHEDGRHTAAGLTVDELVVKIFNGEMLPLRDEKPRWQWVP